MNMKKIYSLGALAIFGLFAIVSCVPQERSDYSLGKAPTADQLDFTITPTTEKPNIVEFANNSDISGVAVWDLGNNGATVKGDETSAQYPIHGTYTVTMTLYSTGGSASISKTVTITDDDMSLLNTPMYNALTGGASNLAGKTWVFDQYHSGHFGVGPADGSSPSWWSAAAEDKTQSCLYTQKFTFTQIGVKMVWQNNGYVYTNNAGRLAMADLGYTNAVVPGAGDYDVEYAPKAQYTFTLNEQAGTLSFSDGAFFGHYAGTSTYQILTLNDTVLYVKCVSTVEPGNGWWYRFIPIEKNVKPVIIIPVKAIPLAEDFEGTAAKVALTTENMGPFTSASYSNPAPVPINQSAKVYLYQKSNDFYSNIFFATSAYKFDLTTQNKIHLKVFLPSYNDYTTDNSVAGSWIANAKLQKKVAVKLQNSSLGGNAWTTQTEVDFTDLATDTWLDLTFDFSSVSTRQDYDKIVIQFGGEGHSGAGIFFFDDFSFSE
jgi:PKD repeat protein